VRILFVTWDGPQVSYLESLFLPIFERLASYGHRFDVLQFRWGDQQLTADVAQLCERSGVGYQSVEIWRRFGGAGAFASATWGGRAVRQASKLFRSDVVMARSLMPALSTLIGIGSGGIPLLFDADGLAADERVDFAGLSPRSMTYRVLRGIEAAACRQACAVLVRSEAAANILRERAGLGVGKERFFKVSNGRDPHAFHPHDHVARAAVREGIGIAENAPLLIYAGSVGAQYRLPELATLLQAALRLRPDTHLLVLSGSPEEARAALLSASPGLGAAVSVFRAAPSEVSQFLAAADLGTAYRTPSFSMQGVAPIKVSEYLLCGLPVVGTAGVGDTRPIMEAGLFRDEADGPAASARWFIEELMPRREEYRARAREIGLSHFSLGQTVDSYLTALESCTVGRNQV
jgi:glycosyltransferase involved in cell wall biosynthesis